VIETLLLSLLVHTHQTRVIDSKVALEQKPIERSCTRPWPTGVGEMGQELVMPDNSEQHN
jgi:hypothetical protein